MNNLKTYVYKNMNKIKILAPHEAQKIAAGEVVERPANVIKEIVENSIDAGATQITLYIEKAGKELIRIVDNGSGMSPDDAKLCFAVHATSKITKIDDLAEISSFGFRGEALASIAAISKVTLITKAKIQEQEELGTQDALDAQGESQTQDILGTRIEYAEGQIISEQEISAPAGTDISIADLFYNIPARKKFLKQDETEWNQILAIFQAFCLSHTHINFKLFHDNKLIVNAPQVQTVKERASQLWGYNMSQNLIELAGDTNISGYISHHNFWKYGRTHMFFFVNNRWIKNQELGKGLLKGYLNVLPPQKFPAAFIFITVDSNSIDFNVHPKKEEVRFTKPLIIQNALEALVKQTLQSNMNKQIGNTHKSGELRKEINTERVFDLETNTAPVFDQETGEVLNNWSEKTHTSKRPEKTGAPIFDEPAFFLSGNPDPKASQYGLFPNMPSMTNSLNNMHAPSLHNTPSTSHTSYAFTQESIETPELATGTIIGQLFNTYILIENKENFVMIDQHAAHERILYEKFVQNFEKKDGISLMFPEVLTMPEHKIQKLLQERAFFSNQGIELEIFGEQKLVIKTSPPNIKNQDLKEFILEAADFIEENETLEKDLFRKKLNEHLHSQLACKSAIKAGDLLDYKRMQNLIDTLQVTNNRIICVHGRPTTWVIPKEDIEKKFKRR
ncbi:MAG: DNA mismatch repair endonuclease MutL [bacterium]